jgi:hypothetical protein
MAQIDLQAHNGDTNNHRNRANNLARQQSVDTWANLRHFELTSPTPPATENVRMTRPTYVEGIAIRRLPDAPETPARWRRSRVTTLPIAAALETLRNERESFGSDASTDTRSYAPTFQESDQDLEPVGTTFVTTELDGAYVDYRDRK